MNGSNPEEVASEVDRYCSYLQVGDLAYQILARAESGIASPLGQHESLCEKAPVRIHQPVGQLLDGEVLIHHQRVGIHESAAGLAPEQLLSERAGVSLDEREAGEQPDRHAAFDHRDRM